MPPATLQVRIDCPSLGKMRARYRQAPRIVREEMRAGMESATAILAGEIRARAPGKGGLRGAITPAFNADRTQGRVTVAPGRYQAIARYQEAGTGIHGPKGRMYEIVPRVARVLRFQARGGTVFARRVLHPGVKPHWMFRDGSKAAQPRIQFTFRARLGVITRRIGRR